MKADRTIHIVATKGEIEGSVSDGKLYIRTYNKDTAGYNERVIDFMDRQGETGGHFGGDKGLVDDFLVYLKGGKPSISTTVIEDSLVGHLLVYDANKSVKKKEPVKFEHNIS